jgi:hypothetical protein
VVDALVACEQEKYSPSSGLQRALELFLISGTSFFHVRRYIIARIDLHRESEAAYLYFWSRYLEISNPKYYANQYPFQNKTENPCILTWQNHYRKSNLSIDETFQYAKIPKEVEVSSASVRASQDNNDKLGLFGKITPSRFPQ